MMSYSLVFVCTGNTCRSPMAEGLFNRLARAAGLDACAVSCGLSVFSSMPASALAAEAVRPYDVDLSDHMSRQADEETLGLSDAIYGMTAQHAERLCQTFPAYAGKVRRLADDDIGDPFGGDAEAYRAAADQIRQAVESLIEHLNLKRDGFDGVL